MTYPNLLDYGLVLAYIAIMTDISLQIGRIWQRQSSGDVSIMGTTVRALASGVFLTKYVQIQDKYLTIGQSMFLALLGVYLFLLVKYRIRSIGSSAFFSNH